MAAEDKNAEDIELFRVPRDAGGIGLLELFADLDVGLPGTAPTDPERIKAVLERIEAGFHATLAQPHALHGMRAQRMFARMVEAFGTAALSKTEDAAAVARAAIRPPDQRVVLPDGETLLIEVKNHHPSNPMKPWSARKDDHDRFLSYCAVAGGTPYYAIYWSVWNVWTLLPATLAKADGRKVRITMETAAMANRLADLGDLMIGTRPPLSVSFRADPDSPNEMRRVSETRSDARFTIGGVEFKAGGRLVTDPKEQGLCFFFMMYGNQWDEADEVEHADGRVAGVTFLYEPVEWNERQGFAFIAPLSSMYSTWYLANSGSSGGVIDAAADQTPGWLGRLIPDDYAGSALRLWRLHISPALKP